MKTLNTLLIMLAFPPCASLAADDYCEGEGCPIQFEVSGFEVWVSPVLFDAIDFSYERIGLALDIIRAQISYIDPPDPNQGIPNEAMTALREVVTFYLGDTSLDAEDPWWPCGSGIGGCISSADARIGLNIRFHLKSHLYDSMILHELAHAYHGLVIADGSENECIAEAFRYAKYRYAWVLNNYHWSKIPPHEGAGHQVGYATTNAFEWFAESAEAYWVVNGSYPFNRHDLWKQDPIGYRVQRAFWNDPEADCPLWAD